MKGGWRWKASIWFLSVPLWGSTDQNLDFASDNKPLVNTRMESKIQAICLKVKCLTLFWSSLPLFQGIVIEEQRSYFWIIVIFFNNHGIKSISIIILSFRKIKQKINTTWQIFTTQTIKINNGSGGWLNAVIPVKLRFNTEKSCKFYNSRGKENWL